MWGLSGGVGGEIVHRTLRKNVVYSESSNWAVVSKICKVRCVGDCGAVMVNYFLLKEGRNK